MYFCKCLVSVREILNKVVWMFQMSEYIYYFITRIVVCKLFYSNHLLINDVKEKFQFFLMFI